MAGTTSRSAVQKRNKKGYRLVFPKTSWVVKHRPFLKKLYRLASQPGKRRALINTLESAHASEVKAICESASNLLRGTFPRLNKRLLKKFIPYKALLRQLACKEVPIPIKRKLLVTQQKGGQLLPIATLLAPVISSLIGKLF